MKSVLLLSAAALLISTHLRAADAPAAAKGQWVSVQEGTGGVVVDRITGEAFVVITGKEIFKEKGQGIWKSTDGGATFVRADGGVISGRCETGYGLYQDPAGKRLYCFMLDGASGYTLDGGQTWEKLKQVNRGWDCAAVDWTTPQPQTIYGVEHESGGKQHVSTDGGKSWTKIGELGKDQAKYTFGIGVVDAKTLLRWSATIGGIERSADTGATWTKVSDELPTGHVMVVFKGTCYWVGAKGLLTSKDQGATWAWQGTPPTATIEAPPGAAAAKATPAPAPAAWGPYFGKDEKQIVVASKDGISETTDGGGHWSLVAPLPDLFKRPPGPGWYLNVAFDPVHDAFYTSWMGKPTFRWQR